jgi:hypothetical protein
MREKKMVTVIFGKPVGNKIAQTHITIICGWYRNNIITKKGNDIVQAYVTEGDAKDILRELGSYSPRIVEAI